MVTNVEKEINFRKEVEKAGLTFSGKLDGLGALMVAKMEVPYFTFQLERGHIWLLNATAKRVRQLLELAQQTTSDDEFAELCTLQSSINDAAQGQAIWKIVPPGRGRITLTNWLRQQGEDVSDLVPTN